MPGMHFCSDSVCVCAGFFVFACATLGVLMVMETLSAFLHALRCDTTNFLLLPHLSLVITIPNIL